MNTTSATSTLASGFLLALVQFLAVVTGPVPALLGGVAMPILTLATLRFFHESPDLPRVVAIATVSSAAAVALAWIAGIAADPLVWLAPLLAGGFAAAIMMVRRVRSRRCSLCNRAIGRSLAFECPRCGLLVCERSCWVFERVRCALCERNEVPILPADSRWWDRQLGPRVTQGRCQLCMTDAAETDLRACHRCGRPQCRACWDSANGQCSRCAWVVEDLPAPLRAYQVKESHA